MRRAIAGIQVLMLAVGWVGPVLGQDEEEEDISDVSSVGEPLIVIAPSPAPTLSCLSDSHTVTVDTSGTRPVIRSAGYQPFSTIALSIAEATSGTVVSTPVARADNGCVIAWYPTLAPGSYVATVLRPGPVLANQGESIAFAIGGQSPSATRTPPPSAGTAPQATVPRSAPQPQVWDFELKAAHITMFSDRSYEIVGLVVNNGNVPAIARLSVQGCSDAISRAVDVGADNSSVGGNIPRGGSVLFDITGGPLSYDCHWGRQTVSDPQSIRGDQVELTIRSVFTR